MNSRLLIKWFEQVGPRLDFRELQRHLVNKIYISASGGLISRDEFGILTNGNLQARIEVLEGHHQERLSSINASLRQF